MLAGVKEVREAVAFAQANPGQPTVLFLDEVHRFNKAQQDAFLPFVEDGTLIFIGATTENPAFALNNALLSRARVYVLKPLADAGPGRHPVRGAPRSGAGPGRPADQSPARPSCWDSPGAPTATRAAR